MASSRKHAKSGASAGCPTIVSREEWGARQPKSSTSFQQPRSEVVVHHTDTKSCTNQSSCSGIVRGIQSDHMNNRVNKNRYCAPLFVNRIERNSAGWNDIGYNFLVGGDGRVYEGRGWDSVGAHAPGHNSQSFGMAFIGDYSHHTPSSAAQDAARQLIDCGVSSGRLSQDYHLHGHRDVKGTECPGQALYNDMQKWPRSN